MKVYAVMEDDCVKVETRLIAVNKTYEGACKVMEACADKCLKDARFKAGPNDDVSIIIYWEDTCEGDEDETAFAYYIKCMELGK